MGWHGGRRGAGGQLHPHPCMPAAVFPDQHTSTGAHVVLASLVCGRLRRCVPPLQAFSSDDEEDVREELLYLPVVRGGRWRGQSPGFTGREGRGGCMGCCWMGYAVMRASIAVKTALASCNTCMARMQQTTRIQPGSDIAYRPLRFIPNDPFLLAGDRARAAPRGLG